MSGAFVSNTLLETIIILTITIPNAIDKCIRALCIMLFSLSMLSESSGG